jgi:Flp pilus assembly protein CpaB
MDVAEQMVKVLTKLKKPEVRQHSPMGDPIAFGDVPLESGAKRSPLMIGGGVLFALLAMFVGALIVNSRGSRQAVVVSATEIAAGTKITREMLRVEHIEADSTLRVTRSVDAGALIGQVARERIGSGVLVLADQVGTALEPPSGFVLVAMVLEPGELPVASLTYGDRVEVVRTPTSVSADDVGGVVAEASVWSMWGSGSAQSVTSGSKRPVTLAVPEAVAVAVTQAASRHEIRLIARGGGPIWAPDEPGAPAARSLGGSVEASN